VIKADGSDLAPKQLTDTLVGELGPHWIPSPDGDKIVYQRPLTRTGNTSQQQIWVMNSDGTGQTQLTLQTPDPADPNQLPHWNQFPSWGQVRAKCASPESR
jgi:Tol biopolymer transport system component